ncbi:MAG: 50S ribosomal protein L10 [Nitrospirae bacterium]|nr:50S ribosomal protein L10 [Nitrospirota bacterium]MBF0535267.1 50S ribosomal protein L10 [Nitrospirota bacterium]MBF0615253.1 50S ribosomal protein L10 [Nitrospirota bacterium]
MNKQEKEVVVSELKDKFSRSKSVVFTNYTGMTVADLSDLRVNLRKSNIEYKVVKNTLAKLACEGTAIESTKSIFTGPVGLAIGYDDPISVSKRVFEYAKGNDKFKVLNGFVEGRVFDAKDLKKISELPPREVLLSQVAGCMSAPATKMASLLDATVSRMVNALNALKDKKTN